MVTIATRNDGDDVVISVRDEGIGVAREDLSRIFDRFERVETGIAGRIAGTGPGLSIAREIASLHGGRLWADSEPELGSTFHLAIPASTSRAIEKKTATKDDACKCKRVAHYPGTPITPSPYHPITLRTFVRLQVVHQILLQRLDINDLDQALAEVLAEVAAGLRSCDRAHARRDGNRIDQCSLAKLRRQRPQTDLIDRQLRSEVRYAPRKRLRPLLLVVTVSVQVGGIAPGGKPLHAAPSSSPARV
jgi:hypothetical protein